MSSLTTMNYWTWRLQRGQVKPPFFSIIVAISRRQIKPLGWNSLIVHRVCWWQWFTLTAARVTCVCPWFYNVLIMNNMWPEATVYTPDRETLLVWFSLNRSVIINKYLLLINPNYHLWEKMSPNCVHGKNLLDLVNTICGTRYDI